MHLHGAIHRSPRHDGRGRTLAATITESHLCSSPRLPTRGRRTGTKGVSKLEKQTIGDQPQLALRTAGRTRTSRLVDNLGNSRNSRNSSTRLMTLQSKPLIKRMVNKVKSNSSNSRGAHHNLSTSYRPRSPVWSGLVAKTPF